jgi:diguanylate cyclase (GGDEF)-like protein
MPAPAMPANELARLQALFRHDVLDTQGEDAFDRISRVAGIVTDSPIVLLGMIDSGRHWFKAKVGVDLLESPRELSFCGNTILDHGPLLVPDATADSRFSDNPLVAGAPGIRFYMGIPLTVEDGANIGTLCVFDLKPRELSDGQKSALNDLAMLATRELELHRIATTDSLTGALDRKVALHMLEQEAKRCAREGAQFSFAKFDLDQFKRVNDALGHDGGDDVIAAVARTCRERLRPQDTLFRLGGQEFAVLFADTPSSEAEELAGRLKQAVNEGRHGTASKNVALTASFGLVAGSGEDGDPQAVLTRAERAHYAAKRGGGGQLVAMH